MVGDFELLKDEEFRGQTRQPGKVEVSASYNLPEEKSFGNKSCSLIKKLVDV